MEEPTVRSERKEFGEVEVPADWRDGLPSALVEAVEAFLITNDSTIGTARVTAIRYLLDLLLDAETPAEIQAFAEKHRAADLRLQTDRDGNLRAVDKEDPAPIGESVVVPNELLATLLRDVMTLEDPKERLIRETCLSDALGEAMGWLVDQEKLLGHLLLAHEQTAEAVVRQAHDDLAALHASIHQSPRTVIG